ALVDPVVELMLVPAGRLDARAREASRRIPGGHRGLGGEVPDAPAHATALARLDLVAAHEPGVPAATRRHRLPDPLRGGVDVDVPSDLELVRHASFPPAAHDSDGRDTRSVPGSSANSSDSSGAGPGPRGRVHAWAPPDASVRPPGAEPSCPATTTPSSAGSTSPGTRTSPPSAGVARRRSRS